MDDKLLRLIKAIQDTKILWEDYKTEEIRVYLEYLKGLYDRELEKVDSQSTGIFNSGRVRFVFRVVCVWCVSAPPSKNTNKPALLNTPLIVEF